DAQGYVCLTTCLCQPRPYTRPSLLPPTHQVAAAKTVLLFSGVHLARMTFHPFLAAHASARMLFTSTGSTRLASRRGYDSDTVCSRFGTSYAFFSAN
ncbi:MAG: hypothetical protein WCG85_03605, partial [Polyangia bacterium]